MARRIRLIRKDRRQSHFRCPYDVAVTDVCDLALFELFDAVFQNPRQDLPAGQKLLGSNVIGCILPCQIYIVDIHHVPPPLCLYYMIYIKKKEIYAKRFPFVRFLRFAPSAAPLTMKIASYVQRLL